MIEENNKLIEINSELIDVFMGFKIDRKTYSIVAASIINRNGFNEFHHYLENSQYHTSWDWLMPVVEKISQHKYEDGETAFPRTFGMSFSDGIETNEDTVMVRFNRQLVFHGKTLIEATYQAVIEFINWYNQQPHN